MNFLKLKEVLEVLDIQVNNMIKLEDIKPGAIVVHKRNNKEYEYTIINTDIKFKFNGTWYNAILYEPEYKSEHSLYCRTIDDFMNNFSLKQND